MYLFNNFQLANEPGTLTIDQHANNDAEAVSSPYASKENCLNTSNLSSGAAQSLLETFNDFTNSGYGNN